MRNGAPYHHNSIDSSLNSGNLITRGIVEVDVVLGFLNLFEIEAGIAGAFIAAA